MLANPPIRLAQKRDARPIAELSRDSIEHGLRWTYDRARILKAIANPSINVAVARERGRLLGFGIMEYGDEAAHLVLLGVRPDRQGRGLGRRLVGWLERCALVAGIRRVRVEARLDNPGAIAFYRRLGYREIRRFGGYYDGRLDAVQLEKPLGARLA
ncbi:MAG: GNAT family N-acetyltransferase [Halofilum sp. (in: g-proteobacteria)]|nr:GNAT family N-acetyltransferase [Halofilum sp. (in: g-proteobacteria)]